MNCKKFPNAFGCPKTKDEATGFISKIVDSACSLASTACDWGVLPEKCCEAIEKSACKGAIDNKQKINAIRYFDDSEDEEE